MTEGLHCVTEKLGTLMIVRYDVGNMASNRAKQYADEARDMIKEALESAGLNLRFLLLPNTFDISFINHVDDGKIEVLNPFTYDDES